MRRITVIGMIILGLVALPLMAAAAPPAKVDVCHFTGDGESHTIEVSEKALQAHLDHGDTKGACDDVAPTTEPPVLTAAFTYTISEADCSFFIGCPVNFDATTSEGLIDSYLWSAPNVDNEEGVTATMLLPNLAVTTVTLIVSGPDGETQTSMDIAISVLP